MGCTHASCIKKCFVFLFLHELWLFYDVEPIPTTSVQKICFLEKLLVNKVFIIFILDSGKNKKIMGKIHIKQNVKICKFH